MNSSGEQREHNFISINLHPSELALSGRVCFKFHYSHRDYHSLIPFFGFGSGQM